MVVYKHKVIRGICFGIGQSIAGLIVISLFGKSIYRYVIKSFNEIESEKKEQTDETSKTDVVDMQKMYNETVKDDKASEECLLSDGETIKIKQPKIVLKRI